MVQVRRPPRYRSPPPRKIPALPLPIRFEPPTLKIQRKTNQHLAPALDDNSEISKQQNSSVDPTVGNNNFEESLISVSPSSNLFKYQDNQIPAPENNPFVQSSYMVA